MLWLHGNGLTVFREVFLRAVSLMIQSATRKLGNLDDFTGQFNSSAFILITSAKSIDKFKEHLGSRLVQSLDYFYPLRDRELPIRKERRLAVKMFSLLPDQGPFRNLDDIKSNLVRKK